MVRSKTGGDVYTYNHWPLHTYAGDTQIGQAAGQDALGIWYAIRPPGEIIRTPAT